MKYALFALGLLLLFVGAYSVYFGYGIIEIERGWSSVIAGTTAFVGGLLIVGVAWIINTLEQIRTLLRADASNVNAGSGVAAHQALQGSPTAHGRTMDLPIPAAPMSWPPHTFPVHTTTAPSAAAPQSEPEAAGSELAEAVPEETRQSPFIPEPTETVRAPAIAQVPATEQRTKPPVKTLWRRFARETEATSSGAYSTGTQEPQRAEPAAPVQPPPLPPAMAFPAAAEQRESEPIAEHGDWLDHAFAELDASLAQTASSAVSGSHAPEPSASEFTASEPDVSEPVSEPPPPDFAAEPPPLAHEPASPEFPFTEKPAIIGRYEAEGTNYVMYADGSIEAHSERGVAHFNSMTELKAYFETQGTPQ